MYAKVWEWIIAVLVLVVVALQILRKIEERQRLQRGSYRRSEDTDILPEISISTWIKENWKIPLVVIILLIALSSVHSVPAGTRGVLITFGNVEDRILPEGLNFKLPWQTVVDMKVRLEKEEVFESTASHDLQEITTQLAVHFNVIPGRANEVYRNMRKEYHSLLLIPVIQEDLKACTAQFTAEELITQRPLVVLALEEKLRISLEPYGIAVQTVNLVDFQFSESFSSAIEEKVTAEQEALKARNVLERVKWEQQQEIARKEAEAQMMVIQANATAKQLVIEATANALKVKLQAEAEAFKILAEAEATAQGILLVSQSVTPEYTKYMYLLEWDGDLPHILAGVQGTDVLLMFDERGEMN